MSIAHKVYPLLNYRRGQTGPGRTIMLAIQLVIVLNVLAVIAQSVQPLVQKLPAHTFWWIEVVSVAIFTVEYVLRVLSATADPRYSSPVSGRLRFCLTPLAIVDLLAILPFYLTWMTLDLRVLRLLRVVRLLRLGKLARYSRAFQVLGRVLQKQRDELAAALILFIVAVVLTASLMYFAEAEAQPDVFTSIPMAMWWSVITLTTVGYGDLVPVTPWGCLVGALSAILGVTLFALLAGILVTGFVEEIRRNDDENPEAIG